MNTKEIGVTKDMGFTAYEIAGYLLKKNHLDMADEHYTFTLEKWIIDNNSNNYRFAEGKTIKVPNEENDIVLCVFEHFKICSDGVSRIQRHDGWRLTINGKLVRGKSGWLRDENGLYILKDGRRLNGGHKECTDDLKIGDKDILTGLISILRNSSQSTTLTNKYNTRNLLRDYGSGMSEVVFQAFQINICYSNSYTKTNPYILRNNVKFYSIGRDETDIPIVVTEIKGPESQDNPNLQDHVNSANRIANLKKLVIAGPHGDERNAQRLIMTSQKYFIQNGVPLDTVLYFIPCLSPTMAFADARGIPNEFLRNGGNVITIPRLHEAVNQTMRDKIQRRQPDPINPQYGVDANRDYHRRFESSKEFIKFIDMLKIGINVSDFNMDIVETTILYQNKKIDANPVEIDKVEGKTIKNIRVFMIHGYVSSVSVYGPYSVSTNGNAGRDGKMAANMSEQDKIRVDEIMERLGILPWNYTVYENDDYFYDDTKTNAAKYQGEWVIQLYNKQIWAADIELPSSYYNDYNEGIRYFGIEEGGKIKHYTPSQIGLRSLPYFQDNNNGFYNLLRNFI